MDKKKKTKPRKGLRTRAPKKKVPHNHKKDGTPRSKPVRPTHKEFNERLERASELLRFGYRDGQIRSMLSGEFKIKKNTAAHYVSRARKILIEELDVPKTEHQANSYAFYTGIVSDLEEGTFARLAAQKRIDKLLGLEAAMRLNIEGKIDHKHMHLVSMADLDVVLKELKIKALPVKRKLLERLRERTIETEAETTSKEQEYEW